MSNITHLAEVMAAEAELTEQLVEVIRQQQHALVNCDSTAVENSTEKQQELMLPIEGLEQERARLTKDIWNTLALKETTGDMEIDLTTLLTHLDNSEAKRLSSVGSRLHDAVETMMKLNEANQFLIEQSRRFVRETFRIVTNGYSRKLVDQKI